MAENRALCQLPLLIQWRVLPQRLHRASLLRHVNTPAMRRSGVVLRLRLRLRRRGGARRQHAQVH